MSASVFAAAMDFMAKSTALPASRNSRTDFTASGESTSPTTSSATDPDLNTAAFQVKDVDGGGFLAAVRTLSCVGYEESHWWEDAL